VKTGLDQEASGIKKAGKLQCGYKRHDFTDDQAGLVVSVHTTAANLHESQHIEIRLHKTQLPRGSHVLMVYKG